MKNYIKIIIAALSLIMSAQVLAQDVMVNADADGNITVDWVHPPCVAPKDGWEGDSGDNQPYEVKYKKTSALFWETPVYSDGSTVFFPADLFEPGYLYKFRVKYYGRNADCRGFRRVRFLGTEFYHYDVAVFEENIEIVPGHSKKIHGLAFDKCLYPYTWAGGSVDSVRIHNWGCYSSPPKAFFIEELSGNRVRMESQTLGLCIRPKGFYTGQAIGVGVCDTPFTIFIKIPVGSGAFKLQNEVNGKCMYAIDSIDGALASQNECNNNDDRQDFYFEDY